MREVGEPPRTPRRPGTPMPRRSSPPSLPDPPASPSTTPSPPRRSTVAAAIAVIAVIAAGALHIAYLRFQYDDAYITYRYADHLARGLGLVFNAGERVEGYSNFLWTVVLAAVIGAGGDPETWAPALGAAAMLGALAVTLLAAAR